MRNTLLEKNDINNILDHAHWYIRNRVSGINAFIVIKGDEIITEQYYNGHTENTRSHITSITKSIISLLIGIAIDKGFIKSTRQPIKDFLKNTMNRNIGEITIQELLTMCSGIVYPSNGFSRSDNWVEFIVGLSVDKKKQGKFHYEDGNAHLLSAIISSSTGFSANELANKHLFGKIGMDNGRNEKPLIWSADPQGINTGGWGLHLTAKEMASIGAIAVNDGFYKNDNIVSSDWIKESSTEKIKCSEAFNLEKGYGYGWWTGEECGYRIYFARGIWEQYIINVPELNITFVFKGDENAKIKSNVGKFWRDQVFRKLIE